MWARAAASGVLTGDPAAWNIAAVSARRDGVERAWGFITPILEAWEADTRTPLAAYEAGSDGPTEADALPMREGRVWRPLVQG